MLIDNPHARRVVVYTWNFHPDLIASATAKGASGYLSKTLPARDLVTALQAVHAGEIVISAHATHARPATGLDWPGRTEGLTDRESEILALITQGKSNLEVAAADLPVDQHDQVIHPLHLPQDRRQQPHPSRAVGHRTRLQTRPPPHRPLARRTLTHPPPPPSPTTPTHHAKLTTHEHTRHRHHRPHHRRHRPPHHPPLTGHPAVRGRVVRTGSRLPAPPRGKHERMSAARWCPGERSATARQALGVARTDRWSRRCSRSSAAPRARWRSTGRRRPARRGRPRCRCRPRTRRSTRTSELCRFGTPGSAATTSTRSRRRRRRRSSRERMTPLGLT